MKLRLNYILLALLFASTNLQAESKKIIKWVDKNGVTQYGDRAPLPSKAKKASVLNKQGITVKKINHNKTNVKQDKILAAQARQDNALLASYNSVEEIDIAHKRNTKIDELALASFQKKLKLLHIELSKNNATVLAYAKDNKVAPTDNLETLERNMADIALVERKIDEREKAIDAINQRFANNKARYKELESRKGKLD